MFRDKADEIAAKGEARRGHFNPDADSAHLKVYKWWQENTPEIRKPARENFCHYWRVVLIWAPFIWLVLHLIINPIMWIADHLPKRKPRKKDSFWKKNFDTIGSVVLTVGMIMFGVCVAVLLVQAVIAFWNYPTTGLLIVGILVGLAAIVAVAVLIAGKIRDRKSVEYAHRREAWRNGEISDDEYFGVKKKEPGKIRKFFKGVGDFCHLAFQVVRVKKWKICPFVEIPEQGEV